MAPAIGGGFQAIESIVGPSRRLGDGAGGRVFQLVELDQVIVPGSTRSRSGTSSSWGRQENPASLAVEGIVLVARELTVWIGTLDEIAVLVVRPLLHGSVRVGHFAPSVQLIVDEAGRLVSGVSLLDQVAARIVSIGRGAALGRGDAGEAMGGEGTDALPFRPTC